MNTATHTCPPLEDIAAFLDGKLSEGERARVVAHLADCESCYAVFAGAARFQLEEEDGEAQGPQEAAAALKTAAVVPFHRRAVPRWALPLAALLLIGLATIPLYLQYSQMPEMVSSELVDPAALKEIASDKFAGERMRSGDREEGLSDPAEFLIGAHLVDLRLTLERNDRASADVMSQIYKQMGKLFFMPEEANFYQAAAAQIDPVEGPGTPPREFLEEAIGTEKKLTESLDPAIYLAFGKWTEAGRLSAIARRPDFFEQGKNRRFLRWLLRNAADENIAPEIVTKLREIRRLMGVENLQEGHYNDLEARFDKILDHYQRESRFDPTLWPDASP